MMYMERSSTLGQLLKQGMTVKQVKPIQPGTPLIVKLHDGRKLQANFCRAENTVSGLKVVALSGTLLLKVNAEQISQLKSGK